jgi:hypothetical protein
MSNRRFLYMPRSVQLSAFHQLSIKESRLVEALQVSKAGFSTI